MRARVRIRFLNFVWPIELFGEAGEEQDDEEEEEALMKRKANARESEIKNKKKIIITYETIVRSLQLNE